MLGKTRYGQHFLLGSESETAKHIILALTPWLFCCFYLVFIPRIPSNFWNQVHLHIWL